jgi:hypothetical protein
MKLPPNLTFENLHWLLNEDLSNCKQCGKAQLTAVAEHYRKEEPWQSIAAPNYRRQAILIGLQNELRREALNRNAEELNLLRAQIKSGQAKAQTLKAVLEAHILQGATLNDYAACVSAWVAGDDPGMNKAAAEVERKHAEWRAKCEREAKAAKQTRLKHSAEVLRQRAPGFTIPVNWFAPMPVYNHVAHNNSAPWGYCQATGQDRWKVKDFLRAKKQTPVDKNRRKGAGKPLDLYGFETNLLVLDKWLGDWLLNSRNDDWKYHDTDAPGKTFWVSKPERVCETIYRTASLSAHEKHADAQVEQFRAVLQKHWQKWWTKLKDKEVRAGLERSGIVSALAPGADAWRIFHARRQARWTEITAKVRSEKRPVNGPKPYADVWDAYERLRELLG